jgi:hypothetical protein
MFHFAVRLNKIVKEYLSIEDTSCLASLTGSKQGFKKHLFLLKGHSHLKGCAERNDFL